MRKLTIPALALMLLASCAGNKSQSNAQTSTAEAPAAETQASALDTIAPGDVALKVAALLKQDNNLLHRDFVDQVWTRSCEDRPESEYYKFSMYCEYRAEYIESVDIYCYQMDDGKYFVIKNMRDGNAEKRFMDGNEYYIFDGAKLEETSSIPGINPSDFMDEMDRFCAINYDGQLESDIKEVSANQLIVSICPTNDELGTLEERDIDVRTSENSPEVTYRWWSHKSKFLKFSQEYKVFNKQGFLAYKINCPLPDISKMKQYKLSKEGDNKYKLEKDGSRLAYIYTKDNLVNRIEVLDCFYYYGYDGGIHVGADLSRVYADSTVGKISYSNGVEFQSQIEDNIDQIAINAPEYNFEESEAYAIAKMLGNEFISTKYHNGGISSIDDIHTWTEVDYERVECQIYTKGGIKKLSLNLFPLPNDVKYVLLSKMDTDAKSGKADLVNKWYLLENGKLKETKCPLRNMERYQTAVQYSDLFLWPSNSQWIQGYNGVPDGNVIYEASFNLEDSEFYESDPDEDRG
ncbi:MAG: hypothetical protein MJZ66_11790 [Bacteroidales bacterium]|nr:hypothetical protein [Bacteroidales bacterium]